VTVQTALLPDGRLHLQHGPIDCLCRAWGDPAEIAAAYAQAAAAFPAILPELCAELAHLRTALPTGAPEGAVARAMHAACIPYAAGFITPMAAVAGAVADAVLAAMTRGRVLERAFVNNGGDIAFHLAPGTSLRCGLVAELAAPALDGVFTLRAEHPARGLASSGRATRGQGGRSFSLGIADAVSVLATTAAQADAAATVIANAVDLPGHAAILRRPARDLDPDSDLQDRHVTWEVGRLMEAEIDRALDAGAQVAESLLRQALIAGAVLVLRGRLRVCGMTQAELPSP
jgi:ApbE superfamily uncharacterized protein (UPF0280 family)